MSDKRSKSNRSPASVAERTDAVSPRLWHRLRTPLAIAAMMLAILVVYLPSACITQGQILYGNDHFHLHAYRIRYFQEGAAGSSAWIPGWYTREILGTPFQANIQSFPWIPSRLVLLWMEPFAVLTAGANLSACLAGLFTFLFCRRLGLGRVASAAGGWTFACSGFFASRVLAGHLPLLEAYPALPLLLWLTDRLISGERLQHWRVLSLGLATACIAVAGHPQLSIYSLGVAALYALFIGRRRGWVAVAAMLAGVGLAAFALVPTVLFTQHTTRVLPLDIAVNDIAFPYRRLLAFLFPWRDGWSALVQKEGSQPFTGYPSEIYFWDTVCYVGWLPLLAVIALSVRWLLRIRLGNAGSPFRSRWLTLSLIALTALVLALPFAQPLGRLLPGTFLRSPARQIYIPIFVLALAPAAGCDVLLRQAQITKAHRWIWLAAACLLLAAHFADLLLHDRPFMLTVARPEAITASTLAAADNEAAHRVAIDSSLTIPSNRQLDDVGFFDSLILAGPYRLMMALASAPPGYNTQVFHGAVLSRSALAWLGVEFVMTEIDKTTGQHGPPGKVFVYQVPNPQPRAMFVPASRARQATEQEIDDALKRIAKEQSLPEPALLLDRPPIPASAHPTAPSGVRYLRQDSDTILLQVSATEPGYVRLIESADPGWHGEIDGSPAEIATAYGALMAIPVTPGTHDIKLAYSTPGTVAGGILSGTSLLILIGLEGLSRRRKHIARQEST